MADSDTTRHVTDNDISWSADPEELTATVYDLIRTIRDPEKPESLEELDVVYEEGVTVTSLDARTLLIRIEFIPTVSHCSLATLIGLCLRVKLERCLPEKYKLDIFIKDGTHDTGKEVNKQINDKERVAAALENSGLRDLVEECISEQD